jgi:hypothetical protein
MALSGIKSTFKADNAKVKSVGGMVYNGDVAGSEYVALIATKLIADATKGFAFGGSGQMVNSVAVAATAAGSSDSALVSQGYVATQLAAAAGVSKRVYAVDDATGLATGKAVALGTGTNAPLVLADKSGDALSNAIGIIVDITGLNVTVQLDASALVAQDISALAEGTPLFVGASGALVQYSALSAGEFATVVGYVDVPGTTAGDGSILVMPRAWGSV